VRVGCDARLQPRYLSVGTGFVGAYATFSTFSYETVRLLEDGATRQSLLNIAASLAGGLAAAAVGPCPGRGSLAVAAALWVAAADHRRIPRPDH